MREWSPLEVVLLLVSTGQSGVIAVLAVVVRDLAHRDRKPENVEEPPESEPPITSRPIGFRARARPPAAR